MVRVARRDTYGIEDIGGVPVRRRVFTGQPIPDHYDVESDAFEDQGAPPEPDAAAQDKFVRSRAGTVSEEKVVPDKDAPPARPTGGGRRTSRKSR